MKRPEAARAFDRRLGARLREARRAADLTQSQLGALLSITYQQVQKYEKGENGLSAARLSEICRLLNIAVADLLAGTEGTNKADRT